MSIDAVEEAILGCGLPQSWEVGVAAYEAARVMAEPNLQLGHDVVVAAVNDSAPARRTWRSAASSTGADLRFVHLVVSDPAEHRRRLSGCDRGVAHVPEPGWRAVRARRDDFAPWAGEHLEVVAGTMTVAVIASEVIAHPEAN